METKKNICVVVGIDTIKSRGVSLIMDKQQAKRLLFVKTEALPLTEIGFGAVIEVERESITDRVRGIEVLGYCAGPKATQEMREKYGYKIELEK